MSARLAEIADAIELAQELTRKAPRVTPRPGDTGWMPFDLFEFGKLAFEAVPWAGDGTFLEVGAGTGPDLVIARALGCDPHGIEILDSLAAIARANGLDVETADAATWDGYGKHACTWLNRPFRDPYDEHVLEQRIYTAMPPGAVLIGANLSGPPPSGGFHAALDEWGDGLRKGIWVRAGG